jgi:hypothetical protein
MTVKINGTNTVANPAFTGADTDTGLQCGTDELKLVTGGSARATVDSSGRFLINNTSATQSHPLQVTADSGASAIVVNGRSSDDISELSFFENDRSTKLGEIQYRQDHLNFRHRVGDIRFATGGTTERVRIQSAGGISFNGDTAQTNAIDDYEEGTWSPGVNIGTCTASDAKYIKIGKFMKVCATITGFSDRTTATILQINNVPYASSQVAQASGSMFGRYIDRTAYTSYVKTNGSVIEFYTIGSGNFAPLQHQHLNNGSSLIYLQASWIIN